MMLSRWIIPCVLAALLVGCGGEPEVETPEDPAPESVQEGSPPGDVDVVAEPPIEVPIEVPAEVVREPVPVQAAFALIDDGEWIGPINGLKFGIRPMGTVFDLDGPIPMLLLVHNTTDRKISWPGFKPETSVRRDMPDDLPEWKPAYDPDANLRVWIEPNLPNLLDNETRRSVRNEGYSNHSVFPETLGPGQTSVHLFTISTNPREGVHHYHPDDSIHTSTGMLWYDNNLPSGYTIKIRYQAGGFESPAGKRRGATLAGWEDVWVNFHPVNVTLR